MKKLPLSLIILAVFLSGFCLSGCKKTAETETQTPDMEETHNALIETIAANEEPEVLVVTATPPPLHQMISGNVLATSNFNDIDFSWMVGYDIEHQAFFDVVEGKYTISHSTPNYPIFVEWDGPGAHDFQDINLEVTAVTKQGGKDAGVMLMCRVNEGGWYGVLVYHDGYFAILKNVNGKQTRLTEITESSLLLPGWNRLGFSCQGETLSFYANDNLIGQAFDDSFHSGNVALAVFSDKLSPQTVGAFDKLIISQPDEE